MGDPQTSPGTSPGTSVANDVDPVVAARERAVEENREQLASTVDALHDKLDVKAHAQDRVREAKAQVITADGKPRPMVLAAVAGLVVVTAFVVWRRRR